MHKGILLSIAGVIVACSSGSTPTNFAGAYTITVVDGVNNCDTATGWTQGNSASNISATITQDGTDAQLSISGATALYLDLVVGTSTFQGTIKGNTFTAKFLGSKQQTQGACVYTTNANLSISLDSNGVVSGTIDYVPQTNGDPSCTVLNTCTNTQTVSGSRTSP